MSMGQPKNINQPKKIKYHSENLIIKSSGPNPFSMDQFVVINVPLAAE